MSVYLRAYGGTGSLISRAAMIMMMINPFSGNNSIDLSIASLDFDDQATNDPNVTTDYLVLTDILRKYHALSGLGMANFARSSIELSTTSLKSIREKAYQEGVVRETGSPAALGRCNYTLNEVFANGDGRIRELMLSCLEPYQFDALNKDGAYGDLARNAFLAYPMKLHGFTNDGAIPPMNQPGDYVFYVGSTDGGTANTFLDFDLQSYCETQFYSDVNVDRNAMVYSIRTLPYKKHDPAGNIQAQQIADNMIAQSAGVVDNILSVSERSNYFLNNNTEFDANGMPTAPYYLDGLVLVGSSADSFDALDNTNSDPTQPHLDHQFHWNHASELASVAAMLDILEGGLPPYMGYGFNRVAGYNVSTTNINGYEYIFADNFFKNNEVVWRISQSVKLYALVKLQLLYEFDLGKIEFDYNNNRGEEQYPPIYLQRTCGIERGYKFGLINRPWMPAKDARTLNDPHVIGAISAVRETLVSFIENFEPFLEMLYEVQSFSTYGGAAFLRIVDQDGLDNILHGDPNMLVYDPGTICRPLFQGQNKNSSEWTTIRGNLEDACEGEFVNISYNDPAALGSMLLDFLYDKL